MVARSNDGLPYTIPMNQPILGTALSMAYRWMTATGPVELFPIRTPFSSIPLYCLHATIQPPFSSPPPAVAPSLHF